MKVPFQVKATSKEVKEVVRQVKRWREIEEEGLEVLRSMSRYASRLKVLAGSASLRGVVDIETVRGTIVKHRREVDRLCVHLEEETIPELSKIVDSLQECVENCLRLVSSERRWDPSLRAGSSPMSSCEQITHVEELTSMFVQELWRKRCILKKISSMSSDVLAGAVSTWPLSSSESFVDVDFLQRTTLTVELILP